MPLSEYEQRVLEQMEQQLTSDDPRLVNALQGGAPSQVRRWLLAGAGALVGLAVLVIGAVTSLPIVGVLGFVTMFVAVVLALSPPRRRGPAGLVAPDGTLKQRKVAPKPGLTERFEKRWDRRREEREG